MLKYREPLILYSFPSNRGELKLRAEDETSWRDEEKLRQQRQLHEMEELSP